MNTFKNVMLVAFAALLCVDALSQFTNVSDMLGQLLTVQTTYNGNGASFADFNGDGWDDLTIGRGNGEIAFYVNHQGVLEPAGFSIPNLDQKLVQMVLWADYDNDGDLDLLVTKNNGPVELWQNDGNFNFVNVAAAAGLAVANLEHVGAAFCDYDHDGYLDLYIAKFYHPNIGISAAKENVLYRNNGDGTFTDVTVAAGVHVGQRPCFQPVFLDYNNDGWEDLYLITDRVFVENALFRNNGDGTFTNVTAETGAGIMICSMTGTVGDYDNDGDLDVFISNSHVEGSKLMRNEGNELFSEVASEMGVNLHQLGWGGLWIDYDNDTWQDLFMSLTFNGLIPFFGNKLYRNNEGASFTDVSSEMGILDEITESYVSIMADFDHDGYYDFFLNNKLGYTPKLYRNNGGSNNHLSVTLQGVESNMQGIGSWVTCYAGGHAYVRFKLCGENLIGQNGDRLVFGLADHQVVDSLVVNWNRGIRDVIYNVPANQHVHVIEGHSHLYHLAVQTEGTAQLCPGEALTLTVGNFDAYLWSDGSTEPTLTVGTTGTYSVEVTTEAGIVVSALPIEVVVANWPQYAVEVSHERCAGLNDGEAHITLYDDGAAGATWSDGSTDLQRDDLAPGMHTFVLSFGQGCTMGSEIEVLAAQPIIPMVSTSNVSCSEGADGLAIAVVFGGQPPYELDWSGGDPQALIAGQHQLIVTDALGCLMVHSFSITEPSAIEIALSVTHCIDDEIGSAILELTGGTPPYSIDWSNENGNGFLPFGLPAGWYTVHVTDSNNCTASETFEVEQLTSVDEPMVNTCRVYPNPVADRLNVAGCTIRPEAEIRITDMRGQTVLVTNEPRPDVSFLAPGVYTLSIVDARASLVARAAIRFVKAP